jgi:hypothetical protein
MTQVGKYSGGTEVSNVFLDAALTAAPTLSFSTLANMTSLLFMGLFLMDSGITSPNKFDLEHTPTQVIHFCTIMCTRWQQCAPCQLQPFLKESLFFLLLKKVWYTCYMFYMCICVFLCTTSQSYHCLTMPNLKVQKLTWRLKTNLKVTILQISFEPSG